MIAEVFVHPKVKKNIEQMKTLNTAPGIAARRARDIIKALVNGAGPALAGRLLKKKDNRIKNLFKFNLGKGFRLITIKEQDGFYILFIGDHDQCERWLSAYSRKNPQKTSAPFHVYGIATPENRIVPELVDDSRDSDDPDFLSCITQKDLRKVFCGLTQIL